MTHTSAHASYQTPPLTPFRQKVYALAQKIPFGKVATYGQLALLLGDPHLARAVGTALHYNPHEFPLCTTPAENLQFIKSGAIPCHRIVNARGELAKNFAFDGAETQRIRLLAEGIEVAENDQGYHVDLSLYLWHPIIHKN